MIFLNSCSNNYLEKNISENFERLFHILYIIKFGGIRLEREIKLDLMRANLHNFTRITHSQYFLEIRAIFVFFFFISHFVVKTRLNARFFSLSAFRTF